MELQSCPGEPKKSYWGAVLGLAPSSAFRSILFVFRRLSLDRSLLRAPEELAVHIWRRDSHQPGDELKKKSHRKIIIFRDENFRRKKKSKPKVRKKSTQKIIFLIFEKINFFDFFPKKSLFFQFFFLHIF